MRNVEEVDWFHQRIFEAARWVVKTKRFNEFTTHEILLRLRPDYPEFSEEEIRKAILAKAHQTASAHHEVNQIGFVQVGPGRFSLMVRVAPGPEVAHGDNRATSLP